jgi:hypothetical protein
MTIATDPNYQKQAVQNLNRCRVLSASSRNT